MRATDVAGRLAAIDEGIRRLLAEDADHEARLRALESRQDHSDSLARVEHSLEALSDRMNGRFDGLDLRVRIVERWRWLATGASTAAGGTLVLILQALSQQGGP